MLEDHTAIVGIGHTAFAKQLEPSETQLAAEAIVMALPEHVTLVRGAVV